MQIPAPLQPSTRILLGPGPSDAHPAVLRAMVNPLMGHLDPEFVSIMVQVQEMLRGVLKTKTKSPYLSVQQGWRGWSVVW